MVPVRSLLLPSGLAAVVAAAALAAAARGDGGGAAAPFRAEVVVRELEVDIDLSSLPPLESLGRRADDDFLVLEDGRPRELLATGVTGEGADARGPEEGGSGMARPISGLLVWFDPVLAGPRARALGARALAAAAGNGAFDGCLSVSIADDTAELSLPQPSRDALAVELGRRARRWEASPAGPRATLAARLRALDRLTVELARRGGGGRRALVLVGDGWPVDAGLLNALNGLARGSEGPGVARLRPIEDAARVATAFGWTSYVLAPAAEPGTRIRPGPERGAETRTGPGGDRLSAWMVRLFAPRHFLRSARREEARFDAAVDLGLRPWAHLVRAGGGTLLADSGAVDEQLARLAQRRRLVVRSPDPGPGLLLPLEVRWIGGDGRLVPSRRWVRSGMPPEVAAARLRALAAGDLESELDAPVSLTSADPATGARRVCFDGVHLHDFVRAALLVADEAPGTVAIGPVVEIRPFPAEACALLPEAAPASLARAPGPAVALLEDPESGAWGALRLAAVR